jgi:endoglucanase
MGNDVLIHPSAASDKRPAESIISVPRGWYDAGDYNSYIVNSGITMGTLFSLYEDFPAHMKTVDLNIPESKNEIPDLLDEVLWNLRWMLTMQDPNDGGVYHKCTNAAFDGNSFTVNGVEVGVSAATSANGVRAAIRIPIFTVCFKFKVLAMGRTPWIRSCYRSSASESAFANSERLFVSKMGFH